MSPGFFRHGWLVAGLVLGLPGSINANPTQLGDRQGGAITSGAPTSLDAASPPSPDASAPSREGFEARSSRAKRDAILLDTDGDASQLVELPSARDSTPESIESRRSDKAYGVDRTTRLSDASTEASTIKDLAKATRNWVHEVLPWTADPVANSASQAKRFPTDELILPVEAQAHVGRAFSGQVERTAANPNAVNEPVNPSLSAATEDASPRGRIAADGSDNLLRRLIRFTHDVFSHPLTWFAVTLIGVTRVVMSWLRQRKR